MNGVCICITIFIYREFAVCCIKCAVAVYEERRSTICFCSTYCYAACCYTAACPDSAFAAADAYHCVIIAEKMNIVIQSNIIFLATVFIEAFGYSNISTIGNSTVFKCFCFYIFQLAYVYCIGICFAFCYIDNLTISVFAAYGYCISSVSYTAGTQSNSAFRRYRSTVADSNRIFNCICAFTKSNSVIAYGNSCIFSYSNCSTFFNSNISITINICSSHRRSHARTGHNTCCNQHCQQLFGRAAFTAMIFCDFGDNNICVARLTPNYFEYFVHQKFLPHK